MFCKRSCINNIVAQSHQCFSVSWGIVLHFLSVRKSPAIAGNGNLHFIELMVIYVDGTMSYDVNYILFTQLSWMFFKINQTRKNPLKKARRKKIKATNPICIFFLFVFFIFDKFVYNGQNKLNKEKSLQLFLDISILSWLDKLLISMDFNISILDTRFN